MSRVREFWKEKVNSKLSLLWYENKEEFKVI